MNKLIVHFFSPPGSAPNGTPLKKNKVVSVCEFAVYLCLPAIYSAWSLDGVGVHRCRGDRCFALTNYLEVYLGWKLSALQCQSCFQSWLSSNWFPDSKEGSLTSG
ncbi:hypothetical protein ATANTOWER_002571 [Ataeniobius toweri]|uniref:Uncharacterized protein n=1 Tax=Ataeniobius toweri TaxID=208326 RepID=A0ABU7AKN8_9TELE|nr:hypothetical protein [Ataeniobius toweri]